MDYPLLNQDKWQEVLGSCGWSDFVVIGDDELQSHAVMLSRLDRHKKIKHAASEQNAAKTRGLVAKGEGG